MTGCDDRVISDITSILWIGVGLVTVILIIEFVSMFYRIAAEASEEERKDRD